MRSAPEDALLVAIGNAAALQVIWSELHLHLVSGQDSDVVHPHLSGDVSQNFVSVVEFDAEHRVWKRLENGPFKQNCVFFGFCQCLAFRPQPLTAR